MPVNLPFFSGDSLWNTPLPQNAELAELNGDYRALLLAGPPLHINIRQWTIPVFWADSSTPRYKLRGKITECPLSQGHLVASAHRLREAEHPCGIHRSASGMIPIPAAAAPDGENDAHITIVDTDSRMAYDLWQARQEPDGQWSTNSAIAYSIDGAGVFDRGDFSVIGNNESIHYYGPCRASGVPSIAGLIMQQEIRAGRIAHKLAFACSFPALQTFCAPPAVWTDGWRPGGIPEGITMRLDPDLNLDSLGLSPAGKIVARALQEYGAVLVDYAGGTTLYAQGEVSGKAQDAMDIESALCWSGILDEWDLRSVGLEHFSFIKPQNMVNMGSHPVYHCGMSRLFYEHMMENELCLPPPL